MFKCGFERTNTSATFNDGWYHQHARITFRRGNKGEAFVDGYAKPYDARHISVGHRIIRIKDIIKIQFWQ